MNENMREQFYEAIERATGGDLSDGQIESLWENIEPLLTKDFNWVKDKRGLEDGGTIEMTAYLNGFDIDKGGDRETRIELSWNSTGLFAKVEHEGKVERWFLSWRDLFDTMLKSILEQ